jgi:sec-independent protein translocase protein TatA
MRGPQGWEWLVILLVVLLLFGARRLPDLARSVGRSMRIFRSEVKDGQSEERGAGTPDDDGGPRA